MYSILNSKGQTKGLVSELYSVLQTASSRTISIMQVWVKDLEKYTRENTANWNIIWASVVEALENPNHQLIHFNFIHRTYLTPLKQHLIKHFPTPRWSQRYISAYILGLQRCTQPLENSMWFIVQCLWCSHSMLPFYKAPESNVTSKASKVKKRIFLVGITSAKKC